ncbi:MAG: Eco57I restriction-modification methylase domain-containing protein, partial [Dolichospermum sp.]
PTEIWREYITRKTRYLEIREKLVNGEVNHINDLITYNLNIRQFAEDVINNCQDPQFLYHIYDQLGKMSILDPTCGSGAFLFAALNILEPLYDACLEKMTSFLEDNHKDHKKMIQQFRQILNDVKFHHNQRYFILKKIMLNNLYGVDIMEEATDICKLRLLLKLVAQVTPHHSLPNYGIEPLPDIDFNIRAGNSLVGFANYDQVKKAVEGSQQLKLDLFSDMTRIDEKAKRVSEVYQTFRDIQTSTVNGSDFTGTKQLLQESLDSLNQELNEYLAREYGIDIQKQQELEKWQDSHCPFHWFVEFYGIISRGGFDVIIGNPPYVEYSKVKKDYEIKGYQTEKCSNLYGLTIERSGNIAINKSYLGMIVQLPIVCTDRMISLQAYLMQYSDYLYFANFDDRPGKLFDGLEHIRATIVISQQNINCQDKKVYSTNYIRWYSETRNILFHNISYQNITNYLLKGSIPKINDDLGLSIFNKISNYQKISLNFLKNSDYIAYFHNSPQYWIRTINFIPYFCNQKEGNKISSQVKPIYLKTELDSLTVVAILNSSLFYWWFIILSDCRHLNMREIENFPVGLDKMSTDIKNQLITLTDKLMKDFQKNSFRKEASYKTTGKVIYDEYYPKLSKPIIDEIDKMLAEHYGFTEAELDFIINYDIKYRMGKELEEDDN